MPTNPRSYPTAHSLRMSKNTSNSNASAERQPASNYRSCHKCHQRKIRCDKRDPCSPCSRSNAQCAYPPPDQRIKRPRKTTMAKVASRLSDLERLLPSVPSTAGEEPQAIGSTHPTASLAIQGSSGHEREDCSLHTASLEHRQAFGDEILVRRGSRSQYFSEGFLARVIERQQDIQSVLSTPQTDRSDPDTATVPKPIAIFPRLITSRGSLALFPPSQVGLRLWNIYVERIDTCTGSKVLHIPTDEVRVCATIESPEQAQSEDLAFCFAVFYAATVALQPYEARAILEEDVTAAQARFRNGIEQSLAEAEILEHPTLTLLRALSVYLPALRQCSFGKGIWILDGLAIRIAQSVGFHRNGERLKLSPFESELRRRVWWHLVAFDSRTAEDHGIHKSNGIRSDADLPLNVNDSDLHPEMNNLPVPQPGLTTMTFSLVGYHVVCTENRLANIVANSTPSTPPEEALRLQVVKETRDHIEKWLQDCNPVIPRQRIAILTSRLAIRKLDLNSRQQWLALHHRNCCDALTTEDNLVDALEMLEIVLQMRNDRMLEPYSWLWKSHPEYHATMYLLWHLCTRTEGPNVERAWQMVDRLYALNQYFEACWGSRKVILSTLMSKAEKIRSGEREGSQESPCQRNAPMEASNGQPVEPDVSMQDPDLDWGLFAEAFQLDAEPFNIDANWEQR